MSNPKITDWQGLRVWLVGASAGIGAALARTLSARGARLVLSARRADALAALALPDALCLPLDVTDPASVDAACADVQATLGGIDLVVYLAGDYQPMQAAHFDLAKAERLFDLNFVGAARLTARLLPTLHPQPGVPRGLAFVASVAGYHGLPRALAYGPGKAALIHFAECLHLELAPRGLGIWLINPGFVATRLTARNDFAMPALMTPEQAAAAIVAGFAEGRFEIHFPKRFTRWLKLLHLLPYRWTFPLIRRLTGAPT